MSIQVPSTLAKRLAFLVRALWDAIDGQRLGGVLGGRIPVPLMLLILQRINSVKDRFNRLAGRIVAGTYTPRHTTQRQKPVAPKPRQQSPFRERGWLDKLLPPAIAAPCRGGLIALFQDPEMVALIQAAPAPMARLFRPLCWMLKLKPPAILANPRRPAGTPPPPPRKYQPPPPRPPALPPPANTLALYPIQFLPMGGPPKPA